jgi:hypothetical protein
MRADGQPCRRPLPDDEADLDIDGGLSVTDTPWPTTPSTD